MVHVVVLDAKHRRNDNNYYRLYLEVHGRGLRNPNKVVELLTSWAESLRFDYTNRSGELSAWGYFLAELSRKKMLLGVIPEDTYGFTHDASVDCSREKCLHLFIDAGSPVRHIYTVFCENRVDTELRCCIRGIGIFAEERFWINVDAIEEYTEEPGINTIIYPKADPTTKALFERITKLITLSSKNL